MSQNEKYPCLPSRGMLNLFKTKLQSAQRAHSLLRKKTDALQIKFRRVLLRIREFKQLSSSVVSTAAMYLAMADYVAGNSWHHLVLNSVGQPSITVMTKSDNVAGVNLPVFECEFYEHDSFELLCVGHGGQQIKELKLIYREVVKYLTNIATLQISFTALETVIQVTNQRLNALEHVAIPKLLRTLAYIAFELDEYEREDFYRMKITKVKKQRKQVPKDSSDEDSSGTDSEGAKPVAKAKKHSPKSKKGKEGDKKVVKKVPSILDQYNDPDIMF